MRKRAFFILALVLLLTAALSLGLVACNPTDSPQQGGDTGGQGQEEENPPEVKEEWEYESAVLGVTLVAYNGSDKVVTIPSQADGEEVRHIGEGAFADNATIEKLTIPATVRTVYPKAFSGCTALCEVVYEGTLEDWYENVYLYGDWYDGAVFPSVTCFDGTFDVELATYSRGLYFELAEDGLSYEVTGLYFTESAYGPEDNLTDSIVIPAEYKGLPVTAIQQLRSANVDADPARNPCKIVKTVEIRGNNLRELKDGAFAGFEVLNSVSLPEGLEAIGEDAFTETALESLVLPEGVKTLGDGAFYECANLSEAVLPLSLQSIGASCFGFCEKLSSIVYNGTTEQWGEIELGMLWKSRVPAEDVRCTNGAVVF